MFLEKVATDYARYARYYRVETGIDIYTELQLFYHSNEVLVAVKIRDNSYIEDNSTYQW